MVPRVTTWKTESGVAVIEIAGRITLGHERGLIEEAVIKALQEGAGSLVIDLERVSWIDSTGIGIIAYCFGKISQRGANGAAAGAKGLVLEVFKLTRLDTVIHFYPDVAAACDGLAVQAANAKAAGPSV